MRIIAGDWRGRPILAPEGRATRPTSDRAREGLFSMLASRLGSFADLAVADLFAGTGALGLEALSRGAARCLFIDSDRAATDAIRTNLDRFGAGARGDVRSGDAASAPAPSGPLDLIFLDPPYRTGAAQAALARIANPGWIRPGGWISLETGDPALPAPAGFACAAERRFGKAHITLYRRDA